MGAFDGRRSNVSIASFPEVSKRSSRGRGAVVATTEHDEAIVHADIGRPNSSIIPGTDSALY